MKKFLVYLILVLAVSPFPSFGADDLPKELEQLRIRYEIKLEKLRAQHAKRLEKLVEKQTKAGKLDVAKHAKKELEKIRAPKNDAELTKYLADSKWHAGKSILKDDALTSSHILTFQADGKVHKSWGYLRPGWKVKGMKLYYERKVFAFDESFKQMTRVSGDARDPKVWQLKK